MPYAITGIKTTPGPGGQVPLRRELDEWWFSEDENDSNQRSLFIHALQKFMDMSPNPDDPSDLSYFSIAGIHGQPQKPWGVEKNKGESYCVHNSETFPPWHRPYLLLYEQRLHETMHELIPATFAEADHGAMYKAADTWRLPYWDWAIKKPDWNAIDITSTANKRLGPGPNAPFILTQSHIKVKVREGTASVANPLLRYTLPQNGDKQSTKTFGSYGIKDINETDIKDETKVLFQKFYSECEATSRFPSSHDKKAEGYKEHWIKGTENNWHKITGQLRGSSETESNVLPETVYRLFCQQPNYVWFASDAWKKKQEPSTYASLEGVHNNIHGLAGGTGQMGEVALAAFDPIFWLHHCNIDRLFALWQDLYDQEYSNWLRESPKAKDKLIPFQKDSDGSYYHVVDASYPQKDLGYTYPELQKWSDEYKTNGDFDKAKYKAAIRSAIEVNYSTSGKSSLALPKQQDIAVAHMASMAESGYLQSEYFPEAVVKLATDVGPDSSTTQRTKWDVDDYIVNVVYDSFALRGEAFSVRIFLGDVPEGDDLTNFENTPTQVGQVYNFSGGPQARGVSDEGCANCRANQAAGALSSGRVILTDHLHELALKNQEFQGLILTPDMERQTVEDFLKVNLHWRITSRSGRVIPRESMPSLKVSVARATVTHYLEASRFSHFGEYTPLWDVTDGRPSGASPGDLGLPIATTA